MPKRILKGLFYNKHVTIQEITSEYPISGKIKGIIKESGGANLYFYILEVEGEKEPFHVSQDSIVWIRIDKKKSVKPKNKKIKIKSKKVVIYLKDYKKSWNSWISL